MPDDDETGYSYPLARNIIEKVMADMEILERIRQNESDIATILRVGLTPDQIDILDISKANVVIPGTRETFDLDRILEMHDTGIGELVAANLAPKSWVGSYVNGFGFLKAIDFNSKMLTTEFPLSDYSPQTLQEWLTIPPEEQEVGLTPFGRVTVGIGGLGGLGGFEVTPDEPAIPRGTPIREQVGTNLGDIKSIKGRTDITEGNIIDLDVRLDAAEADIDGIIGREPVMGMPSAREVLTSVLPLSILLRTGGTESFQNWLEKFNTRTTNNIHNSTINKSLIDQNYGFIVGNREVLDDEILRNQINFDTFTAPSANFVRNFPKYIREDFRVNFVNFTVPAGTIPYHLFAEWTDPITGEYKRSVIRFQVADNVKRLLRLESDIGTRLEDIRKDVDDIKGFRPVLGISDYDNIVDHLKARDWDVGEGRALFQTWLEEFNSRTLGNGQLIGEVTGRVGLLEGGLGDFDTGFRGDNQLRDFIQSMKDEMANMREGFKNIVEDIRAFPGSMKHLRNKANEEFVFPISADTMLDLINTELSSLMDGGLSRYNEKGIDVKGNYEYYGLKNAFGDNDNSGLRGSSNVLSGSADGFGSFGKDNLDWSPM